MAHKRHATNGQETQGRHWSIEQDKAFIHTIETAETLEQAARALQMERKAVRGHLTYLRSLGLPLKHFRRSQGDIGQLKQYLQALRRDGLTPITPVRR